MSYVNRSVLSSARVLCGGAALTLSLAGCGFDDANRMGWDQVTEGVTVCGRGPTVEGIDVSYYQGMPDWNAVRGAGKQFAIARIGDGTYRDPQFARNWQQIRSVGMIRGAYQFFRPNTDPIVQADIVVEAVGRLGDGDLPVTCDVEAPGTNPPPATYVQRIQQWVDRVTAGTGKRPIIYTGFYYWRDTVGGSRQFNTLPLWHAQYTSAACPNIPDAWSNWHFWQYSSTGRVAGISGNVDLNRWNGTLDELRAFAGAGTPTGVYGATYVAQSFPLASAGTVRIRPGETIPAWIELRNTGTLPWNSSTRLGTTGPRDRMSMFAGADWVAPNRPAGVTGTIAPNATYRFQWNWHGPSTPGRYSEHFAVLQEGVSWFGDAPHRGPADNVIEAVLEVVPGTVMDAGNPTPDAGPEASVMADVAVTDSSASDVAESDAATTDAATTDVATADAGARDASAQDVALVSDARRDGSADGGMSMTMGGCGCRTTQTTSSRGYGLGLLAMGMVLRSRRKRGVVQSSSC